MRVELNVVSGTSLLMEGIADAALAKWLLGAATYPPQELTNMLWACAKVGFLEQPFLDALASLPQLPMGGEGVTQWRG